jgi:hypothetical protein
MVRVTVELVRKGDPNNVRLLGVMEIANVGGTEDVGDYSVRLSTAGDARRTWRQGIVRGFPRKRLLGWDLLYRALKSCGLAERNE